MAVDTDRLVQIAADLKELDRRRDALLAELARIAGIGAGPVAGRRRRGRPPGSRNRGKPTATNPGRTRRKGLTADIVGLLSDGNAYTAGDVVEKLRLSPRKGKVATVGATLSRLMKQGSVKKDATRGYRAA
jgi:hypothetical protein